MKDFRKLEVWDKAHKLALSAYRATEKFPREESYGLTSQIRRAAVSIPTNIAEGCGRGSDSDFGRFLQIAMGSASELEYEVLLSRDLGYLSSEIHMELEKQVQSVKQMLAALLRTLHGREGKIVTNQSSDGGEQKADRG
jgi:four helix bundle protein